MYIYICRLQELRMYSEVWFRFLMPCLYWDAGPQCGYLNRPRRYMCALYNASKLPEGVLNSKHIDPHRCYRHAYKASLHSTPGSGNINLSLRLVSLIWSGIFGRIHIWLNATSNPDQGTADNIALIGARCLGEP